GVAARARLQLVEEVEHDFGERDVIGELYALGREVVHAGVCGAALLAELHDPPTNSFGAMIEARMYGSRISAMSPGSGMSEGLCTTSSSPLVSVTSTSTEGIVASSSRSYSRSRRSRTMSMCRSPRKPQRKPKPSASEVSGSHDSAASFSVSFSSASRRSG